MLTAKKYYSGFPHAHDTYNAISKASDGKIYYILSSELIDEGGKLYVYDPASDETTLLADLTEICGEAKQKAIAQGKSHTRFYEYEGKLYFSTHVGYYEMVEGMERLPAQAPDGFALYPGGHILCYDLKSGAFEELAIAPDGEGFVAMHMDVERGQIFGITWPTGLFLHYDLARNEMHNMGPTSARGEAGIPGEDFRVLCRSILVDDGGKAYYSTAEGDVFCYDPQTKSLRMMPLDLRLDYFGKYDYTRPGSMGYNWRKIFWYAPEQVAYAVHGNSGYLFRLDPKRPAIELVQRISSEASQKCGMFDQFSYGYLGFQLGPDGETIYYLTGSPVFENGNRVEGLSEIAKGGSKGQEYLHLITYHIPSRSYRDHGPVFYADGDWPSYVNAIAVGDDGAVYTLGRMQHDGAEIADLIRIPDPLTEANDEG
ncbi:hypothetical protein H8S90_10590 [Olivibacter sp. SDN3]|uniref:hypothetical protein n=1 Tax=Olivibacter sp. SDN3 TaxID=2764720 RepID=UPI00165118FC|nr:hypothetical protein [Olivibacter sp. SDN3]QNL51976.1 hypothetical protein H8S90_10590 [Olivibacter sp. SDN3]